MAATMSKDDRVDDRLDDRLRSALGRLAELAASGETGATALGDPLESAMARIAEYFGMPPATVSERAGESVAARTGRLADETGLALRQVTLRTGWSACDAGPLLVFNAEGQPLAMIPDGPGYRCWNQLTQANQPVKQEADWQLGGVAFCFYRRLPDVAMGLFGLMAFGLRGLGSDLRTLLGCAAAVGLLGLVVPMATAWVFDDIVPGHFKGLLYQLTAAIAILALLQLVLTLTNGVAMLRIESKAKLALQAAVVDRLIRLPAGFFRNYMAGDLGQRTLGVEAIGTLITGSVASSLFAGIFSVFGFSLLFHYHPAAAAVAVSLSLLLALLAAGAAWLSMQALREKETISGKLTGMVLELFNGVERIRLAGAEDRLFARWAHRYADMRECAFRAQRINAAFSAFTTGYRILAIGAIFAAVAWAGDGKLAAGAFVAFVTAFGTAFVSLTQLATTVVDLLSIRPTWERMQAIMETAPESSRDGADPGQLSGSVDINNVHFRYADGLPNVLRGATLKANPGEFIAIVGSSGCGKSTLFRLLLGFESPSAGAIYFDGHELGSLDIRALRQQIGTVLQHDMLIAGSMYENIRGANDITVDDAWQAAHLAGISEHIESLPMGMHTMIGDTPSFSGGEMQRLLIARALAGQPRILLLDEATSALDNRVQAVVSENLSRLTVTRIVIAHRLSTIKMADRIYVLDGGQVVQEGRYTDLIDQPGLFAELVRKQLM
jgi:NHLM bacteriocin system ABC transporter ATP-binding protein